jgi:hypothetical protein
MIRIPADGTVKNSMPASAEFKSLLQNWKRVVHIDSVAVDILSHKIDYMEEL